MIGCSCGKQVSEDKIKEHLERNHVRYTNLEQLIDKWNNSNLTIFQASMLINLLLEERDNLYSKIDRLMQGVDLRKC